MFYNEKLFSSNDKEHHINQLFFWIYPPSRHKIQVQIDLAEKCF